MMNSKYLCGLCFHLMHRAISNTCPIDLIHYYRPPEDEWSGDSMTDVVMRFWLKRGPKLIHD